MTFAAIQVASRFGAIPPAIAVSLFFHPVTTKLRPAASARSDSITTSSALMLSDFPTLPGANPARFENSVAVGPGHTTRELTPVPFNSWFNARLQCNTNAFDAPYVAMKGVG